MNSFFLILTIFISSLNSEPTPSMDAWESIFQTPELISYFEGVFDNLGIIIEETGESFTVHHSDTKFIFKKGIIEE